MTPESRPHLLVVDDIMENIQVAVNILRHQDYELLFATDGPEALEVVAAGGVDLILLDVMMPGMSGFEVCRQLKQDPQHRDIPVIFLTAKTDPESLLEGFDAGAVDYIHKPFNASELIARVDTHMRLRQTEQGLRRLLAEKDRFLDIVAHQIDAPFGGLRGMLRMIQGELDTLPHEDIVEYLGLAVQTSDMVGGLLENLIAWSKLQTGGFGLRPQPLPLLALMDSVARLRDPEMAAKGVHLEICIDPELHALADLETTERALEALVSNAVKFNHEGGQVQVVAEAAGAEAHLMIRDSGIGIPADRIRGLFDPLEQLRREGSQGESGSGLGLPLARALIERNGGALSIESEEGKGTVAHVRLPLHRPPAG